jgi:GNAT superfamily N-acetyltransferase
MIQSLTIDNLYRTRRLGKMFADEVKLAGGYCPEKFEEQWGPIMAMDMAKLFYGTDADGEIVGFLGASYFPDLYSGVPAAQMQFWFLDPAHRKGSLSVRLFAAFEKEAVARGAKKYFVGHKVGGPHATAMNRFFESRGYKPGELIYWRNTFKE